MPTRKPIRQGAPRGYQDRYGPRQSYSIQREQTLPEGPAKPKAGTAEMDRAVLVLSERHGVSDEQLATLLGCAPEDVAQRRANAQAAAERVDPPAHLPGPAATGAGAGIDTPAETAPAAPLIEPGNNVDAVLRGLAGGYMLVLLAAVLLYKSAFVEMISVSPLLSLYGLVVVFYISSRFLFSAFYRPGKDHGLEPHVAVVMPGFNEENAIALSLRSLLELDYPAEKLEIVAVNDGSTDNTLSEMTKVAATTNGRVRVINFPQNRGKRAAMAAGIRATNADIVAFVDSDSVLDPRAMHILVQGFHDPKVGGICGHADVLNVRENWMTKMQAVRYFVAFSVNKAAESVFNTVTCCSGCFSAYRREAIMPRLDWWENQKFLGRESTFGDDRSLTNCVLRDWKVKYEARAVSHTIVPNNFRQFLRQQLRWKRSWTRESLIVARFIWKKNPLPACSVYIGILLPIVAPIVAVHAIIMMPVAGGGAPMLYLLGVYAMSVCYGLYYAARKPRYDDLWVYGIIFCFFYLAFLLWQTYWAIATTRSASWGTRPATAGLPPAEPGEATS
ncbi:MAG TPA: glycosyltransferase [Solirubrobacteraceae bacterium]|nr:glycosyltransferase [Solirubrobacteraceae bacterium]